MGGALVRGSSKAFGRLWPGQNLLIFKRFHVVLFRKQHEMWSKQHNGKVSTDGSAPIAFTPFPIDFQAVYGLRCQF
jgi:hypothetical protein